MRTLAAAALAGPLVALGCATSTGDLISSRRFKDDPSMLFTKEDPVAVLARDSSDGDQRIDAMHRLVEPIARGGSQKEQDAIVKLLIDTATSDPQGLCRAAAVEALGRFKDPRAAEGLLQAYRNAPINTLEKTSIIIQAAYNPAAPGAKEAANFSLDLISLIQCQTMEALGLNRSEAGKKLLIEVASKSVRKPEAKGNELDGLAAYDAEHYRFDIRLAAINALRNYAGDADATRALIEVLKSERDVAIQSRCMSSLREISKLKIDNDPQAWIAAYGGTAAAPGAPTAELAPVTDMPNGPNGPNGPKNNRRATAADDVPSLRGR